MGRNLWSKAFGVNKALTTSMMVFSTAFGTAIFGMIIDLGYSIESIAILSSACIIMASNILVIVFKENMCLF